MPIDPMEPESVEEPFDVEPVDDDEAPEADAAEQRAELTPRRDGPPAGTDRGGSANPADLAEQARTVDLDDDDYR